MPGPGSGRGFLATGSPQQGRPQQTPAVELGAPWRPGLAATPPTLNSRSTGSLPPYALFSDLIALGRPGAVSQRAERGRQGEGWTRLRAGEGPGPAELPACARACVCVCVRVRRAGR